MLITISEKSDSVNKKLIDKSDYAIYNSRIATHGREVRKIRIQIERIDSVMEVKINGNRIENVTNYKVTSSANGITELELKISFESESVKIETSTNQKEQTS